MDDEKFSKYHNEYIELSKLKGKHGTQAGWLKFNVTEEEKEWPFPPEVSDRVNSPSHYTQGSQEAIVTIEEAIDGAPSVTAGMLQAQVLKYLLRVWYKDNPLEDLKKSRWYLNRLIEKLQ